MGTVDVGHDPAQQLSDLAQAFPDILSLLRSRALVCPQGVAIEDVDGMSCSYADLLYRIERLALHLAGHVPGQGRARIGIVLPNGAIMSQTLLAVTLVGAALPFNPGYTLHEFESYFAETDIGLLVTVGDFAPLAQQAARTLGIALLDIAQPMADAPTGGLALPDPDDTAMVLLTSGSTGKAKRVPLTHRNVCTSARDVGLSLRLTPTDRCLSMWELYHVGGLVDLLLAPLHSGGAVIATRGFDAARFFDNVAQYRPTWFQAVPTALGEIALLAKRDGLVGRGGLVAGPDGRGRSAVRASGAADLRDDRSRAADLFDWVRRRRPYSGIGRPILRHGNRHLRQHLATPGQRHRRRGCHSWSERVQRV